MLHDFVWDIEAVRVLDESPARFASARIPADCDIGIEVRYDSVPSVLCLDCDRLEEKVHCGHETLLGTGTTVSDQAFPVAMSNRCQFAMRDGKNKR